MDGHKEGPADQHMVLDLERTTATGVAKRSFVMAPKEEVSVRMDYNSYTDVMFVDVCPVPEGSRVQVYDFGEALGFPGQIQIRVDSKREVLYGMTIQNYSGFKRKLKWRYRMWSVQRALELLIATLRAGLGVDDHHDHPALCN
jgi:hypothetical protein